MSEKWTYVEYANPDRAGATTQACLRGHLSDDAARDRLASRYGIRGVTFLRVTRTTEQGAGYRA